MYRSTSLVRCRSGIMKFALWLGLLALPLISPSPHANAQTEPLNVEMANSAWSMLNENRYEEAIQAADLCVITFVEEANNIQDDLIERAVPKPIPSQIRLQSEREAVFSRGLLNDVAACYYVKLAAAIALRKSSEYISATYRSLLLYSHALVWDPGGWFWSPVEAARSLIARVNGDPTTDP